MASDLSQLQAFLNGIQQNGGADPVVVNDDNNDTAGMSFAELFSHYLAPEVAKLPPSSTASTSDTPAPFTFGGSGESVSPTASTSASTSFDPSTFMPHIPGSPIGTFSPSSASDGRSPMSFPDLDFLNTTDPTVVASGGGADAFSIDPSIFNPPAMFEPLPAVNAATPSSFDPATLPTFAATGAPLPPLPSLPLAPPSAPVAAPAEFLAPPSAPSSAVSASLTASGRPKRNVAAMVIPEEEEDEDLYSDGGNASDATTASVATTPAAPSSSTTRKSTRAKKPAAKKARSSSTGAADGKKLPKTSVLPLASETLHKTTAKSALPPVPQWADKPDPEEYAKLSSKEKRQLRNKLSARNFRHRRKEYITTLEDEISSRDTLISSLRDEVGVIRAENTGLRTEVQTLKEKWQDLLDKLSSMTGAAPGGGTAAAGLGVNPSRAVAAAGGAASPTFTTIKQEEGVIDPSLASPQLPPTTQGNAVASTSTARRHGTRSASSQIQLPNLSKDVGASGRRFAGGMGSGGFMSVHTTLVPDVGAQLAEGLNPKPVSSAAEAFNPFSSQSFNPALNALNAAGRMDDLSSYTSHLRSHPTSTAPSSTAPSVPAPPKGTFEDFFASNPYWLLRPDQLDQNRAALYGKLANNAAGLVAAQKLQQREGLSGDNSSSFLPVPNGFRPAFFRSSSSGKGLSPSADSSTTASDLLAFQSPSTAASLSSPGPVPLGVSHQDALALRTLAVAATAQQTLLQRMGGAFWEAFAGTPPASDGKGKGREIDPKKVAAVLSGQARVEVVPVEKKSAVDDLGAALGALNLRTGTGGASSPRPVEQSCAFDEVCRVWTAPPQAAGQGKKA